LIIFDTSIWIEHLKSNRQYFPITCKLLESGDVLAVECIFAELLQGVKNKNEEETILKFWKHLPKEKYENILIEAGMYSAANKLSDHGVGLIDSLIIMHGIKSNSRIWTLDKKLLNILPNELIYYIN